MKSRIAYGYHYRTFLFVFFFFQAEDGIRDTSVTGVQTCALPIFSPFRVSIGASSYGTRRLSSSRSGSLRRLGAEMRPWGAAASLLGLPAGFRPAPGACNRKPFSA